MSSPMQGRCLCGAVHYRIEGPFRRFMLCHCSRCRHATGSSHASNLFCKPDQLQWLSGAEQVQRFKLQEAERFGRSFCRTCGAPVPFVSEDGTYVNVPAGSLDDAPGILPQARIFCASRAVWDDASMDAVPCFDAYPVDIS
ncbi:GFA family protein [Marinobacterium rhizophilum]|uniref:GFA family protein n=1 Tax=Marinobacterium rhizophilum TaxID=420402 RepID=UPI00039D6448|nr:GFA family protein [Marinobacterium rhizophilum]